MQTIFKYSKVFGKQASRQQETLGVFFLALVAVLVYAWWGSTLLH